MMSVAALALILMPLGQVISSSSCPTRLPLTADRTAQYITSPNYPGHYGDLGQRLSCSWVITANATFDDVVIEMNMHNYSLEPATGCWRDIVEVIDGSHDFHSSLKSWCGSGGPSGVFTTSNSVAYVKFSTNFRDNDFAGFILSYWVTKKPRTIVNSHPWTAINYVLLVIGVFLVTMIPGSLLLILIVRAVQARNQKKND